MDRGTRVTLESQEFDYAVAKLKHFMSQDNRGSRLLTPSDKTVFRLRITDIIDALDSFAEIVLDTNFGEGPLDTNKEN